MKTVITFLSCLFLIFFISSCSKTPEEKIQASVEKKLQEWMKYPETYEFVSINNISPLTIADSLNVYAEQVLSVKLRRLGNVCQSELESCERLREQFSNGAMDEKEMLAKQQELAEMLNNYRRDSARLEAISAEVKAMKELAGKPESKTVVGYTADFKCRGQVKEGTSMEQYLKVLVDNEYKFVRFLEESDM